MPYIGTSPSNGVRRVFDYTATAGQTSFSGSDNNSQTLAYTDSAYIDVYQNGILLIPSDYTATTGTTVVLDTGATVSDTLQIVVYDVFSVADTVSASDGGSFGGNVGVGGTLSVTGNVISPITLAGTTPTLTIGDAGAEDAKIVFDGNAQDYHIGLDDSADSLTIGLGSTLGTTSHIVTNASGAVTKPLQPYFSVYPSSIQSNISNSGYDTIAFGSETFDVGSNFASNTFTAPVTGKYHFSINMRLDSIDTSAAYYNIEIQTSNRSHAQLFSRHGTDPNYSNFMMTVIADMDANDTVIIRIFQNGGTSQTDINTSTTWYGYLLG